MPNNQSVTTYVMSPELPWPDAAIAADALGALDPVALFKGGEAHPCAIRRISSLGATVRGAGLRAGGEPVAIELETGQRAAGTLDWSEDGEAGLRFAHPIDMIAILNRKLLNQPGERRTMPRVEIRCPVGIKWGIDVAAATLRNISAGGLQLHGEGLPPRDTFVTMYVEGLNLRSGIVMWQKANLAGVEFMEELGWSSLMQWVRETMRNQAS